MKRVYVLLLVLLLLFAGCARKEKINNISVEDVCCPYEIKHQKDGIELILRDGGQSEIQWRVETIPEDYCQVTQENIDQENTWRYRLTGKKEGVVQVTFTALRTDETVCFVLTLLLDVDAEGKAVVSDYQHHERKENSVQENGLRYKWNVDTNGILNFSFLNEEDNWSVRAAEEDIFIFSNMLSTPSGCRFSAQAKAVGKTTIILVGENSQRTIHVVIQADESGKMELVSVQEQ